MFKRVLEEELKTAVKKLGYEKLDIVCAISENSQFGDYTTNIALQLAKQNSKNSYHSPVEIANAILKQLGHPPFLERVEVAGVGFINFFLKDESLLKVLEEKKEKKAKNIGILVEYAHPNTHKAFHIGHLRNISIGESISRLLESQGVRVFRVTYGGDIGPHVAKALWGVGKLKSEYEKVKGGSLRERAEFLGKAYALGSTHYEEDEKAKEEINILNKKLYARDPEILGIWEETKKWSIGYFESIYNRVGTEFEAQIWESEIEGRGKEVVSENIGKVFIEDQGAIIFPGEKYGLHNRVFLTSAGYPTYEAKELGLTLKEEELFPFDKSYHIVASEQAGFFKVVIKALEMIEAKRVGKKHHISYGMVNLSTGKMSSRKGEVITAESMISLVSEEIGKLVSETKPSPRLELIDKIAIGAIKFSFLKYSLVSDIAFDIKQSVSLQGDSGPYVQYTFARTHSLVSKWFMVNGKQLKEDHKPKTINDKPNIELEEREVLRLLEYFEETVEKASKNLEPSQLAEYLLKLSKAYNLFYQKFPILGSKQEKFRLFLTKKTGETLKEGLYLMGIQAPERM